MKPYADRPIVAVRQFVTDLLVALWCYAWIRVAWWLHDRVELLGVAGQKLESAGGGLADNLAGKRALTAATRAARAAAS